MQTDKTGRRLAALAERQARITAEMQRIKARHRQQQRKDDTRRKILIGGLILAKIDRGEMRQDQIKAELDSYLERDRDRALFDIPPRQKT